MTDQLWIEPRSVRPRNRRYKRLPVVAVDSKNWVDEDGLVGVFGDLLLDLPDRPSTLFVGQNIADRVAELDSIYAHTHKETWQVRLTTPERGIRRPNGTLAAVRISVAVHYFGFKGGKFHKAIDPVTMYGKGLDDIWPGADCNRLFRLLQWGKAIRDFCDDQMLEVRPTIGAIASQFWTDRRFYPDPRRKVPAVINERARDHLPGNHYALTVAPSPRHTYRAWYVDQTRAHHYHARVTPLPNANSTYASGYFRNLDEVCFDRVEPDFCGLLCLSLEYPAKHDPMLHWLKPSPKRQWDFVFSNELPYLLDMGYKVNGVVAAWGSNERDKGVSAYATFADRQLDDYSDAPWLKPLLLAAYGTLATRASWGETIFKLARRGEHVSVRTGHREIDGILVRAPQKLEPGIVNVIHRGMIEAATRTESLGLAHYLQGQGYRVLAIYADAVMIEVDNPRNVLPALPEPWRVKQVLNHLQYVSTQAFISGEMTKLPGVTREQRAFARRATGYAPRKRVWNMLRGRMEVTKRRI